MIFECNGGTGGLIADADRDHTLLRITEGLSHTGCACAERFTPRNAGYAAILSQVQKIKTELVQ